MATKDQLKKALKERLQRDDPTNFKESIWDRVGFGIYYDNDDELINIVIFETTDQILRGEGRFLPGKVWRNLIAEVGPTQTPNDALTPMMLASQRAEPLLTNDEGVINDRPPQRPTLRGAR